MASGSPSGHEVFLSFLGPDIAKVFADTMCRALTNAGIRVFHGEERFRLGEDVDLELRGCRRFDVMRDTWIRSFRDEELLGIYTENSDSSSSNGDQSDYSEEDYIDIIDEQLLLLREVITPELREAIGRSEIFIPILSRRVAFSDRCIITLALAMAMRRTKGQAVLPIFYDVTPSEVRFLAKGPAGDALSEVAALKGLTLYRSAGMDDGQSIKLVVAEVLRILRRVRPNKKLRVTDNLVGVDDRVAAILGLLDVDAYDVRMVGIHGMGGIGKTTLASIIYEFVSNQFGGCCFIKNVRDMSSRPDGIRHLQRLLVAYLFMHEHQYSAYVDDVSYLLQNHFRHKKVLIVLDDVDDAEQINELAGNFDWFGLGSRIIVTTRNSAVFPKVEGVYEYQVKELDQHDAFLLFCKNAFQQDSPPDKLIALSREIVEATGGLPLSVETIGSYLFAVEDSVWRGVLDRLKTESGIQNRLMISYNSLDYKQKQMFLDIACFFAGSDVRIPAHMWRDCDIFSEAGTEILSLMSLIKIGDDNKIWVHDQFRDLGTEIVHYENVKPENQSRVWGENALKLLDDKVGRRSTGRIRSLFMSALKVVAMRLDYDIGSNPCFISGYKFRRLSNLRYLDLANSILVGDFQGQLSKLRWLGWHGHTEFYVPPSLELKNLVVLDLSKSAVNESWNGWGSLKEAKKLEVLDLTSCHHLKRTPDFSSFPSMKRLIFRDCILLDKIDPSIGDLAMLISLDVRNCSMLKSLPKELGSLRQLYELLLDESSIEEIPNLGGLTNLETFSAKSCKSLHHIPASFGSLVKVQKLLLDNCQSLLEIPNTIEQLESLQELSLSHTRVMDLPTLVEKWSNLEVLNIDHCPIRSLPSSLGKLMKLEVLNVSGCVYLKGEIPFALEDLTSLRILRLDHTNISSLPAAIADLPHLHTLDLEGCMKLKSLPRLPPSLVNLKVVVTSSTAISNLQELINIKHIELQRNSNYFVPEHPKNKAPSSSSSNLIHSEYEHEVFLSFRGPDTRKNFTNILHTMLTREDIITFIDSEELHVGEKIDKLLEAINQSKISIPIFSKGYAYSKWCLKEAAQIVRCMEAGRQEVYPIFYDVDPNEVQNQTGEYEKAFREHVESKRFDGNVIQEWKDALREIASRKGLHLKVSPNRSYEEQSYQGTELRKVILDISNKLEKFPLLDLTDDLVGIEDHIVELTRQLDADANHVKMLGVWGMAGIGKTTVAKSIFNQLSSQFKYHSFLENVRGTSLESRSLVSLQKQLVFDISRHIEEFGSSAVGKSAIQACLKGKKVLILVDDVDSTEQVDYLVGGSAWFSAGSIIIVTTREAHVLLEPKVDWISYEVKPMHQQGAFLLFCKHAFRQDSPLPAFSNLSWDIVEATGRHPLAIQTVGSSLYFVKEKNVWEEARNILRTKKEIYDKLKITYDALSPEQQQIFLDIACLLKGADKRVAVHMWKAQNYLPESALRALLLRSLIKIRDGNLLWMHDLFIELGQEIVRQESCNKVWHQTRLWSSKDAIKVLNAKKTAEKVEAIHLDCGSESEKCCLSHENFGKLPNLEFLRLGNANLDLSSNFQGCLSSLIWLSWQARNLLEAPSGLLLENLVILDLSKSMIKDDWNGWSSIKEAVNLEVLNLSGCNQLSKTPDFSSFSRMERLILEDCQGLVEIGPSIGNLKALRFLDARNCPSLKNLPQELGLLVALTELLLDGSLIQELPISSDMKCLEIISAKSCGSLTKIPSTIGELESLKELNLSRTGVVYLPDSIETLTNLEVFHIDHCLISKLPQSLWKLRKLEVINASGCRNLQGEIPSELRSLKGLKVLRLDRTGITSISKSISKLCCLQILDLKDCVKLQSLPTLPSSLVELKVTLTSSNIEPNLQDLINLKELEIVCYGDLSQLLADIDKFSEIEKLTITKRHTRELKTSVHRQRKKNMIL